MLLLSVVFSATVSAASFKAQVGIGPSSAAQSDTAPALYIAGGIDKWFVTGTSTGVKTTAYYVNYYAANVLYQENFGKLFKGNLEGAIGGGIIHSRRSVLVDPQTGREQSDPKWI